MTTQTAVILFNLGGPDDLASVEPFLVNLFRDREIIQLPGGAALQPWMGRLIAKVRGPSVRDNYRRIGGGSPQLRITREQATALENRLNFGCDYDSGVRVFIAMRYSRPRPTRRWSDCRGGHSTHRDADPVPALVQGHHRLLEKRVRTRALGPEVEGFQFRDHPYRAVRRQSAVSRRSCRDRS